MKTTNGSEEEVLRKEKAGLTSEFTEKNSSVQRGHEYA